VASIQAFSPKLDQIALMLVFHLGVSSPKLRYHVCEAAMLPKWYSLKIDNTMTATQFDKYGNFCSRTIVKTRFEVTAPAPVAGGAVDPSSGVFVNIGAAI
jgi:hypothetical protein